MTSRWHQHPNGFEREVSLMVHTLEVEVVMVEAVILEDVVVEVMVVTKMAEVMGKLEPLHHNMVRQWTDKR